MSSTRVVTVAIYSRQGWPLFKPEHSWTFALDCHYTLGIHILYYMLLPLPPGYLTQRWLSCNRYGRGWKFNQTPLIALYLNFSVCILHPITPMQRLVYHFSFSVWPAADILYCYWIKLLRQNARKNMRAQNILKIIKDWSDGMTWIGVDGRNWHYDFQWIMERVGEERISFLFCYIFFFSGTAASKSVSPGELSIPAIFSCTIQLRSKKLSPRVINLSSVSLHSLSTSSSSSFSSSLSSSRWRFSSSSFLFSAAFAFFWAWLSYLSELLFSSTFSNRV